MRRERGHLIWELDKEELELIDTGHPRLEQSLVTLEYARITFSADIISSLE